MKTPFQLYDKSQEKVSRLRFAIRNIGNVLNVTLIDL